MMLLSPGAAGSARTPWQWAAVPFVAAVAFVMAVAASVLALDAVSGHLGTPGDGSIEAGFARDMAAHHAQAVDMAVAVRDRADQDAVRRLAVDIALDQQAQIGRFHGWLDAWGLPLTGSGKPLSWMDGERDGMSGAASREARSRLSQLDGRAAEIAFLQLMIAHHHAGVQMARTVLHRTRRPEVRRLAETVVASQQSEIDAMIDLLVTTEASPPGTRAGDAPRHAEARP